MPSLSRSLRFFFSDGKNVSFTANTRAVAKEADDGVLSKGDGQFLHPIFAETKLTLLSAEDKTHLYTYYGVILGLVTVLLIDGSGLLLFVLILNLLLVFRAHH